MAFRFAPLQGETFLQRVPGPERTGLRESLVVLTGDGQVLERSQAVLHILHRFGGGWRWLGRLGRSVPRALADALYDWIARIRHRIFKQPVELCPRMNPGQRSRFDP